MRGRKGYVIPSTEEVRFELDRQKQRDRNRGTLKGTVFALVTAAAAAVLVATLWLPVLQIYGSSMVPTLREGEIVVSVKVKEPEAGDIVAFYFGNQVLLKRFIAGPGAKVDIKEDGTVYVDGIELEEPYLEEKHFGICDLELPYQVPEGTYFLMGDQRESSMDSRHSSVGCISTLDVVGKIVFRVWPLAVFGTVE